MYQADVETYVVPLGQTGDSMYWHTCTGGVEGSVSMAWCIPRSWVYWVFRKGEGVEWFRGGGALAAMCEADGGLDVLSHLASWDGKGSEQHRMRPLDIEFP